MTSGRRTTEQMDAAVRKAASELASLDPEALCPLARWWNRWFRALGHRRLGRLLTTYPNLPPGRMGAPPPPDQVKKLSRQDKKALITAASGDLQGISPDSLGVIASWWKRWYADAGHRRLGRALIAQGDRRCGSTVSRQAVPAVPSEKAPTRTQTKVGTASAMVPASGPSASLPCIFRAGEIDGSAVFSVRVHGGQLEIILNQLHPAFPHFATLLETDKAGSLKRNGLEATKLLLESWAYYEFEQPTTSPRVTPEAARANWGRTLRRLILSSD